MNTLNKSTELLSRFGLAAIFIIMGVGKLSAYAGTQAYMESAGLPGALLPLVIALEVGGGLAIAAGLFTRWVAVALAAFSIVSALIFHRPLSDAVQMTMFLKNVAMAGGFLILATHGGGSWSLDRRLGIA